jgi:hypothetical protein
MDDKVPRGLIIGDAWLKLLHLPLLPPLEEIYRDDQSQDEIDLAAET